MRALRKIVFSLFVFFPTVSHAQDVGGSNTGENGSKKPKILFAAQLAANRLAKIDLSQQQKKKFDELAMKLTREAQAVRSVAGIDKNVMSRRDETHSALRERGIGFSHEDYWNTLQGEANLTDEQIIGFKKSRAAVNEFQQGLMSLLTEKQRKQYAKTKKRPKTKVATANDFVGNWALRMHNGDPGWLTIDHSGNQWSGQLWTVGRTKTMSDMKFDGGQLAFVRPVKIGKPEYPVGPPTGKPVPCKFMASVDGDAIQIQMNGHSGDTKVTEMHLAKL